MIRSEIIEAFRNENPEITDRVISDTVLYDWCEVGDKLICAITKCIVSDKEFDSVASTSVYDTKYDLTSEIPKFQEVDEYPGGGVSFDDDPLEKTTVSELDQDDSSWRTRSAGTPEKYYIRGIYLYFDRPISTADLGIRVYSVLISDDFNNDDITPYNQLTTLEPYHDGINKYLQWRAKAKVGKAPDANIAKNEFYAYANWMKTQIGINKSGVVFYQPKSGYYQV